MDRDVFVPDSALLAAGESIADSKPQPGAAEDGQPSASARESEASKEHQRSQSAKGNISGGAIIEVSPSGSWLAWFKQLPIPSPASQYRQAPRRVSTGPLNDNSSDSSIRCSEIPCDKTVTPPGDPLRSHSLSSETTGTLASTNPKNGSTQSTVADSSPCQSQENHPVADCWRHPKKAICSLGSKLKHDVCIPTGKTVNRFWKRSTYEVKKRPRISIGIFIGLLILSLVLLLVIFLVMIPRKLQKAMDSTVLDLAHAKISNPTESSFSLSVQSRVHRTLGTSVTLKQFPATVRYAPSSAFQAQAQGVADQREGTPQQLQHTLKAPKHLGMYHQTSRRLFDLTEKSLAELIVQWTSESNIRGRSLQQNEAYTMNTEKNSTAFSGKTYYDLGRMIIPDLAISGLSSVSSYSSTYEILDSRLFDIFLKELLTLGHSDWVIVGYPAVRFLGFTFHGTLFEKPLPVHGPRLYISDPPSSAKTDNSTGEIIPSINSPSSPKVSMPLIDLTVSTPELARLHLQIELMNTEGLATVDPVGSITVQVKYNGQSIIELTSLEDTILRPGANTIDFFGELVRTDQGGELRHQAMTQFFSSMFRGESPMVEASGIACSVPLFSPAIETIHFYTFMNLKKAGGAPIEINEDGERGLPIIQDMEVKKMELIPNANVPTEVLIKGRIAAVIGNPLGQQASIQVPMVQLKGQLLGSSMIDDGETQRTMASFYGTMQGLGKAEAMLSQDGTPLMKKIGVMPVSIQTLDFDMALTLNLTEHGAVFQKFVQEYVREKHLTLSLFQVDATLTTESSFGPLELQDIPMDKVLRLKGLNGFNGVKLVRFSIESIPFLTSPEGEGFTISVDVMIPSEAPVDIYLGRLYVDLRNRGNHLAYLEAPRCRIAPGVNYFNFTGQAKLSEMDFSNIFPFFRNYISGRNNTVQVEIIPSIPNQSVIEEDEEEGPEWLQRALVGMVLEVDVSGAKGMGDSNSSSLFGGRLFGGNGLGLFNRHPAETPSQPEVSGMGLDGHRRRSGEGLFANLLSGVMNGFQSFANSTPHQ